MQRTAPQIRGIKLTLTLDFSMYNFIKDHKPLRKFKKNLSSSFLGLINVFTEGKFYTRK